MSAQQGGGAAPREGLVWSRIGRPAPARRPALSREQIVAAAIEIADAEGLGSLSMRGIAVRLGAGTMSLYRHIPDKDDLLDLMVDEVYGMIELPETAPGDWREVLTLIATQTRAVLRRHPWFVAAASSRAPIGPNALRHLEYTLAALDGHGLRLPEMARMVGATTSYVTGFVLQELAGEEAKRRNGLTEEQWAASVQPYILEVVASGRYPTFSRLTEQEGEESDPDLDFAYGLDCLFDGFAPRLSRPEPS
ncbi:TetR/AcrR family transcriptional regulator [Sphaerisporangium perillae]|uniref:TetR/AcrR family transcriptional regulator n=1 Tax=Sphaerisporangium perillae TaxID=2935860 RepID=UPI00200E84C0|nr:TetR/AcrR family transcriptional regulator [Sphaerisporangium perillae]